MRIFRTLVIGLTCGAALILGIAYATDNLRTQTQVEDPITPQPSDTQPPQFDITLIHSSKETHNLIQCVEGICNPAPNAEHKGPAVSDGYAWYYYTQRAGTESRENTQLIRSDISSGEVTVVTEETPLTQPRQLIVSPNSKNIAYWLDNIDNETKNLTELWVYDTNDKGTKVVAEKITREDILTPVRWNRSSSHLWFIGDTSESGETPRPEVLVASVNPPEITARFSGADIKKLQETNPAAVDINFSGRSLAYAIHDLFGNKIVIHHDGNPPTTTSTKGKVVFLEWLPDSRIVYATQNNNSVSIWQVQSFTHRLIKTIPGILQSIVTSNSGTYATLLARQPSGGARLTTVNLETSRSREQGDVYGAGGTVFIAGLAESSSENSISDTNITLDDSQIASFIEKNLQEIAGDSGAEPQRFIVTEEENTVLIDYETAQANRRILLTINDAVHVDWSIRARYEDRGGEWIKIDGSGLSDPAPLRLYEWEDELNQWILKEDLDKS